jgi:hypothetical protein
LHRERRALAAARRWAKLVRRLWALPHGDGSSPTSLKNRSCLAGSRLGDVEAGDRRAIDGAGGAAGAAPSLALSAALTTSCGLALGEPVLLLARRAGQEADGHHGGDRSDQAAEQRTVFIALPRRLHARGCSERHRVTQARGAIHALTSCVRPGTSLTE